MSRFNILSIDGGGIKGIVSAMLLERLEEKLNLMSGNPGLRLADCFQLIAGTSTGSILAGLLLCPEENGRPKYKASDAVKLYIKHGREIFDRSIIHSVLTVSGFSGAKFSNKNLLAVLQDYMGDTMLSTLVRPCVIPSYNTTDGHPVWFMSHEAKVYPHKDYPAYECIACSSAAPTFFPPYVLVKDGREAGVFIDGGMVANNPSLLALTEALSLTKPEDVTLLSVGNVQKNEALPYKHIDDGGLLNWAVPIMSIFIDSSSLTADYSLRSIFSSMGKAGDYVRAALTIDGEVPSMDDASDRNIELLCSMGERLTGLMEEKLQGYAENLLGI